VGFLVRVGYVKPLRLLVRKRWRDELENLTNELYSIANKKISRREALSTASKIAIASTTASLTGGILGYLLYSSSKREINTPNVEVKVGKVYNKKTKDYEVGIKVISSEKLDNLEAHCKNLSVEKLLDKNSWNRRGNSYETNFSTNGEIGEQKITLIFEKDGIKGQRDLSVNIGLSEEEIYSGNIPREDLKLLWRDILEDEKVDLDREELFKKECEIANSVGIKNVSEIKSQYLKGFTKTILSRNENHERFLKGARLILRSLDDRPWIYYGNFTRDKNKAEFPLGEEEAYLLTRFASEVDVDEEHLYAARATIDQLRTISLWLSTCLPKSVKCKVTPFDVVEYNGEKIQLWDLTKELFEKQMKYEKMGKRASVKDVDLVKRWSMREETNNKHIYYALRQIQLPGPAFMTDIDEIRYITWYDEKQGGFVGTGQPSIIQTSDHHSVVAKLLFTFKKYVDRFEYFNEFLNNVVKNPDIEFYSPSWNRRFSIKEMIEAEFKLIPWEDYFPNSSKEAYRDIYETLFFKGSSESKYPIVAYATADIVKYGFDEERVEGGILFSSYLGYPVYRIGISYPNNTNFKNHLHGEISFLLNKEDEDLLYKRSNDRLIVERKYTYSLPYLWTRRSALLKDQEEKGEVKFGDIYLPILNEYIFDEYNKGIFNAVKFYEFKIDELF
jgi:hypothetical protein